MLIETHPFYVLNIDKQKKILLDLQLLYSATQKEAEEQAQSFLEGLHIQPQQIMVVPYMENIEDWLDKQHIGLKANYIIYNTEYMSIEEYNKRIIQIRRALYQHTTDIQLQELQARLARNDITKDEYNTEMQKINKSIDDIKQQYPKK